MNTSTILSREEKVKNGIRWLNANHEGWRDRIYVDTLDVGHHKHCILGQLMGSKKGFDLLMEQQEKMDEMGFYVAGNDWSIEEEEEEYEKLTELWKNELV